MNVTHKFFKQKYIWLCNIVISFNYPHHRWIQKVLQEENFNRRSFIRRLKILLIIVVSSRQNTRRYPRKYLSPRILIGGRLTPLWRSITKCIFPGRSVWISRTRATTLRMYKRAPLWWRASCSWTLCKLIRKALRFWLKSS